MAGSLVRQGTIMRCDLETRRVSVIVLLMTVVGCRVFGYDYPFQDPSLPWEVRVDDLVGRLTIEEIQEQMARGGAGASGGPAPAIPRLGIGPYSWNTECLRGDVDAGNATSFPQAIGLAASFSRQLVYDIAEATSVEVRGKFRYYTVNKQYGDHRGLSCFSPVINIVRDPRWGRNQETYGEDPYLSGVMAASFVTGLQGPHYRYIRASAGCKHFAAYDGPENIPSSRLSFDAIVAERDLRTTYLPAFRACVKAGSRSIMCSYNSVNGVPACANEYILNEVLRKQWNFTGYVVSDEGAIENVIWTHFYKPNHVEAVAACVKAGCNLELSGNDRNSVYTSIVTAIKEHKLDESLVRERVKPLFYTRMRLGEFDPLTMNPYASIDMTSIQGAAHRQLSLDAAMKSFVLLKNTGGFLPFKTSGFDNIAVLGPMADNIKQLFGDYSATVMPQYVTSPLAGLQKLATNIAYTPGCNDNKCSKYSSAEVRQAVRNSQVVFVCVGTGQVVESEGNDRQDIQLPGQQQKLVQDAVQYSDAPVVVLVFSAGPVNITWAIESYKVLAILQCFFPAQETGQALIRVLTADSANSVPAARLPYTWPRYSTEVGKMTDYTMHGKTYRYSQTDPLFPFGYGLSYTTFNYTTLTYPAVIQAGHNRTGSVVVHNTGQYDADEVVQVYISWENATVVTPRLQLVDFHRVFIPSAKMVQVNFTVTAEAMAVWVDSSRGWVIEPGTMDLYVGGQQPNQTTSADSNVLHGTFQIKSSVSLGVY
ncbi:uncharacterized protein [Haliotis cracherodii]|uniref:uncharacterized protein n=1 Tax=Haliotis cracherodii TaxID=6455 RepID=UPI0039EA8761